MTNKVELAEFLEFFDFSYIIRPVTKEDNVCSDDDEAIGKNAIFLVDNQKANLGDIQSDYFLLDDKGQADIPAIVDRLDIYVKDYVIESVENCLTEKEIEFDSSADLKELVRLCKENNVDYTVWAEYVLDQTLIYMEKDAIYAFIDGMKKKEWIPPLANSDHKFLWYYVMSQEAMDAIEKYYGERLVDGISSFMSQRWIGFEFSDSCDDVYCIGALDHYLDDVRLMAENFNICACRL